MFVSATTLQTDKITTHVPILDWLLEGGLLTGLLTVIHSNQGARSLKPLLIRFLEHHLATGAVVIDAANQFPAIELAKRARQQGQNPLDTLSRIQILRPFNYHQVGLSVKLLESVVADHPSRTLLILGLPDIYQTAEAAQNLEYDRRKPTFALLELNQAVRQILNLTMKYNLVTVVTASKAPNSSYKPLGGSFLRASAGIIIHIRKDASRTQYILDKHPFLPPRIFSKPHHARLKTLTHILRDRTG